MAASIVDIPGCSLVYRGGVVAYTRDTKHSLLGISPILLQHVVSEQVAEKMAINICDMLEADYGIGTKSKDDKSQPSQ